jgi:hypothetical protein
MREQIYELALVCEGSSSQWLCHTISELKIFCNTTNRVPASSAHTSAHPVSLPSHLVLPPTEV